MHLLFKTTLLGAAFAALSTAQAQNTSLAAQNPQAKHQQQRVQPLNVDLAMLNDLQALQSSTTDGQSVYRLDLSELKLHFPDAIRQSKGEQHIDQQAMNAILLAFIKELKLQNEHLAEQVEHLFTEKAELERQVASITVPVSGSTIQSKPVQPAPAAALEVRQ